MDTLWTRIYPTPLGSGCVGLQVFDDSVLLMGDNSGTGAQSALFRWVTFDGETIDTLLFQIGEDSLIFTDAKYVSEEEIFICGIVQPVTDTFFVASVTTSGTTNWYTKFAPPETGLTRFVSELCVTSTREIATIGTATVWDGTQFTTRYWVVWFNSSGSMIDSTTLGIGSLVFRYGRSIVATRDGGVLVSGTGDRRACFAKYSQQHELEWVRFLGDPLYWHTINSIVQDTAGAFYYTGRIHEWESNGVEYDDDLFVGSLSEQGDSLWMTTPHLLDYQRGVALNISIEGNLIITGLYRRVGEDSDVMYASCTREGVFREFRLLETRYVGVAEDIMQARDSTFFFSGEMVVDVPIGFSRFFLMRTEQDRRTPPDVPTTPILVSPEDQDSVSSEINFAWLEATDPDPFDSVTHILRIVRGNENVTFEDVLNDSLNVNLSSFFDGDLNGSYQWTVEAHSSHPDTTVIAGPQTFHVVTTSHGDEEPEVPDKLILSAFPNPFNSTLSISLDVPLHQDVTLSLYDLLGREVDVVYRGRLASQTISYVAPAPLSSGVYFLRAASGERATLVKVVLLK